jgi:hypothetical protein
MTEEEWRNCDDPYPRQLAIIHEVATVRKLRLIAAVFVRGAQIRPEHMEAKACADVIERFADQPLPWAEAFRELETLPGHWAFTHTLFPEDAAGVAMHLRTLFSMHSSDAFASVRDVIRLIHEIVGNPFRSVTFDPLWRTSTVLALAQGIYDERAFDRMPILADALQDAGCENEDILNHCRDPKQIHVRGCWVVDLALGKA